MGITNGIQIGIKEVYPDDPDHTLTSLLAGAPRDKILIVISALLAGQTKDVKNIRDLLGLWFRPSNAEFANNAYLRLRPLEQEMGNINVAGLAAALKIYSYALRELNNHDAAMADEQIEINLFKAFLVQNEELNSIDAVVSATTMNVLPFEIGWYAHHFTSAIRFNDVVNFDLSELFITELIRATFVFEFLESTPIAHNLLEKFYEAYEVGDWHSYMKQIAGISFSIVTKTKGGYLDLNIAGGANHERDRKFLDALSTVGFDEPMGNDFLLLRGKPLLPLNNGDYRIVFSLFCVERIFKGLYFILKKVNDTLPQGTRVPDLRNLFTFDFSEKHLLYSIVKRAFPKKCKFISGSTIADSGYEGGPDYYVRNGHKAFVFESKDSLIGAALKETGDYNHIGHDIEIKFYRDGNSNKAVKQLLNCVIELYSGSFKEIDPFYNVEFLRVYPILIIHDRQLDVPGFNKILNYWWSLEIPNSLVGDSDTLDHLIPQGSDHAKFF